MAGVEPSRHCSAPVESEGRSPAADDAIWGFPGIPRKRRFSLPGVHERGGIAPLETKELVGAIMLSHALA